MIVDLIVCSGVLSLVVCGCVSVELCLAVCVWQLVVIVEHLS